MQQIYPLNQILGVLENMDVRDIVDSIEEGFVAYSQGKVTVPPVGELLFKDILGQSKLFSKCHIVEVNVVSEKIVLEKD